MILLFRRKSKTAKAPTYEPAEATASGFVLDMWSGIINPTRRRYLLADASGKRLARYINAAPEHFTAIQDVPHQAIDIPDVLVNDVAPDQLYGIHPAYLHRVLDELTPVQHHFLWHTPDLTTGVVVLAMHTSPHLRRQYDRAHARLIGHRNELREILQHHDIDPRP